jgi:hypothetical protein
MGHTSRAERTSGTANIILAIIVAPSIPHSRYDGVTSDVTGHRCGGLAPSMLHLS